MKNYRTILKVLVAIIFLVLAFLFIKQSQNQKEIAIQNIQPEIIQDDRQKDAWVKYHDENYQFDIEHPRDLIVKKLLPNDSGVVLPPTVWDYAIDFKQDDDFSIIRVSIYNTDKITSTDDWLRVNNNYLSERQSANNGELSESWVIEKEIKIRNLDATIVFQKNVNELDGVSKHIRKIIFVKDNNLYEITTRFSEDESHEKVWSSVNI